MFHSLNEIVMKAEETGKEFWEIIIEDDMRERNVTKEQSFFKMTTMYQAMGNADTQYKEELRSTSGLVGGDGQKMNKKLLEGDTLCGDFIATVMTKAIKMGESNACMKKIVAAPTAGSCGVIPAVFLSYGEKHGVPVDKMVQAIYVAAGIGQVIATRASISGAEGGCQAEIGSASAMAAGGIVYLKGGNLNCILNAIAFALQNLLGLVCDPVAGLVEVPCVMRNVIGAVNALSSADLALAGIQSIIPADEVIDAMRMVGNTMPKCLRETGEGGIAASPTGIQIRNHINING